MADRSFEGAEFETLSEALDIAEDKTGGYYKFSLNQWKRHRYDIKTLPELLADEIAPEAFAVLNKYRRDKHKNEYSPIRHDFYSICLQDHQILKALNRDESLSLLSILVYIFTHELIHIVRFCNFSQRFEISGEGREREEQIVHATTFDILKDMSMPDLSYVLDAYRDHRVCELALA